MTKVKQTAEVISQRRLADDVFDMWIRTEEISGQAEPGQFVSLYSRDGARLLPRPISLCRVDQEQKAVRIVYRVAGAGTREFSGYQAGEPVELMGPLGNGFPLKDGSALLIGGGIGIPPMLELAARLEGKRSIVLGYKDKVFLADEFAPYGPVYVATEDGSAGTAGNVLDALRENRLSAGVIYACGPTPMLRALREYALEQGIECYLSLEERMACGIGACLACVCQSVQVDGHSHVCNKRVCADGPVFLAQEVEL